MLSSKKLQIITFYPFLCQKLLKLFRKSSLALISVHPKIPYSPSPSRDCVTIRHARGGGHPGVLILE
jgi:hypothetical protein